MHCVVTTGRIHTGAERPHCSHLILKTDCNYTVCNARTFSMAKPYLQELGSWTKTVIIPKLTEKISKLTVVSVFSAETVGCYT